MPENELLRALFARLLAPDPERRFASAPDVIHALCQATGRTLPPETQAIRESFLQAAQFTGRQAEMQQLTGLLAAAIRGHGAAWLIGGESGVGKSCPAARTGSGGAGAGHVGAARPKFARRRPALCPLAHGRAPPGFSRPSG
ncbi:MAG: ATP-binding protein [Chloroflexi bacterium]|nr:ATP-binding protein [Ardenticatenaceae bacterium]NOG36472.1 ATP-binding protein [Chloroflexota bacterium]